MLAFADKLTAQPSAMTEGDVKMLRSHGFTDRAILDVVLVAGMFNLTNRIVLGLGRDMHAGMDDDAERLGISHWRVKTSGGDSR
jgi:uncharacterized peroxidase-related enzyme